MQRFLLISCMLLSSINTGCQADPASKPKASTVTGSPITEQEAEQFALKFVEAIEKGQREQAYQLLALDQLLNRNVPEKSSASRDPALQSELLQMFAMNAIDKLMGDVSTQERCTLLRIRMQDGRPHLIFRLLVPSLDYLDMTLLKQPTGTIVCDDILFASSGDTLGTNFCDFLTMKGDEKFMPFAEAFHKALNGEADKDSAWRAFQGLPAEIKKQKRVQFMGALAAMRAESPSAPEELNRYRKMFPSEISLDLLLSKWFIDEKKCDEALAAIKRIDEYVGGDIYLATVHAEALSAGGRKQEASQIIETALKKDPANLQLLWYRFRSALNEDNYDAAAKYLKELVIARQEGSFVGAVEAENSLASASFVKSKAFADLKLWFATWNKEKKQTP